MKQQTKGGALHKVWQALPWLWMAAAYLFDLWYQLVPGKWIVDSDLASEMILSDLLNKEGTIISHNWFYSTELKVVNLQWFYRLGLLIFPNDWHLARTFGMAITLALFAAAMLFFVKCAGLGRAGLWMVGTLLWPFGQHYLVYAIYGGYYLVYTFFYMLVLALVLRSLNADKKHCALQWVLACVITAVAGMNGVKQLMVFHAPLCLAAAILLVLALHSCGKTDWKAALDACRKEVRLFAASLVTAVAAAAGYFVSNAVLSRMYDFKSYNFIVWNRDEDWFTLDRILMDFFHEFGYENGSGVFHFGGIAAGIGLLLGCWMFFCIVRLLLRLKKLETNDQLLVLLLVAMLAVCGVAYTYFHEYYLYFWLMNMPVAIGDKQRSDHTENAEVLEILGDIEGKNCLIVDDFTISGGTLVNLAVALKKKGAKRIFAALSHNIISDDGVKRIENSPIETLISTDTVENPRIVDHPKFKTLSVAPIFAEMVRRYHNYESINELSNELPEDLFKACVQDTDI